MAEQVQKLQGLDSATLTPLVRAALERDSITVTEWQVVPLSSAASQNLGTSFGVFRLTGQALDEDEALPWSLVLKIIGTTPGSSADDPASWHYWKREVWIYQSGILDHLPPGLKAARCIDITEHSSHEFWAWFEDVQENVGRRWPLERYKLAGQHLGQFNGAYLAGEPIPKRPWLVPARTPSYLAIAKPVIENLPQLATQPLGRRWFTPKQVEQVLRQWERREPLLHALEQLPRCFCHHDANRRNLIARTAADGSDETVAVDWAFTGTGAVGVDVSLTMAASLRWMEVEASQAHALDQAVFAGYLDGLRAAGWQGEEQLARFGYTANAALFVGLGHIGLFLPRLLDETTWSNTEHIIGHPIEQVFAQYAELQPFLLEVGEEAIALMAALGLDASE